MKTRRSCFIALWPLFFHAAPATGGGVPPERACEKTYGSIGLDSYRSRKERLKQPDHPLLPDAPPERRPKQITGRDRGVQPDGITESPDPTRPIPFRKPDGTEVVRIDATGTDKLEARSMTDYLRGDLHNREHVVRRYADGTLAEGEQLGWDGLVVKVAPDDLPDLGQPVREYPKDYKLTGYLGMMEQPYRIPGAREAGVTEKAPSYGAYNYTRSRHAMDVRLDSKGRETWTDLGSVSGVKPNLSGDWVTSTHAHGYGGRPLLDNEGFVRKWDGSYWMVYERVTKQKNEPRLPWETQVVARRMKSPHELYGKGELLPDGRPADEEVLMASIRPSSRPNADPYPATNRRGTGFLVEGCNQMPDPVNVEGSLFWILLCSSGNYQDKNYGVNMAFRKVSEGPIGPYTWVTRKGDMVDFAHQFAADNHLTWIGRPDGFFDTSAPRYLKWLQENKARLPQAYQYQGGRGVYDDYWDLLRQVEAGKLKLEDAKVPWLNLHYVDEDTLPPGVIKDGPPPSEAMKWFYRNVSAVPVRFTLKNGMPWMSIVDPPALAN